MAHHDLIGREIAELFGGIFLMRRGGLPKLFGWAMPVPTFAVVIPFAFTLAWFSLLLLLWVPRFSEGHHRWYVAIIIAAASITISTVCVARLRNGPLIDRERFVEPLVSAAEGKKVMARVPST